MQPTHTSTVSRSDLRIRAASEADRAQLEAIAAQTWDGDDYLPRVIDDWLKDPHDGFYVATLRDRVVGVIKLTRFAPGEWWMEGLRVDPAYQGHGFARILHHFVINQVRQRGEGTVRFATAAHNEAVRQLARETGFERVACYLPYGADILDEPVQGWQQLTAADLGRVRAWLDQSAHYARAQQSMEWDWTYYRITDARLRERLDAGLVYGWPGSANGNMTPGGVLIVNPTGNDRWPGDPTLKVAYFDVPDADLAPAAHDMRRLAATCNRSRVRIKLYNAPERITALEAAGFEHEWDGEVWLYSRDVHLTQHADVRVEDPSALN